MYSKAGEKTFSYRLTGHLPATAKNMYIHVHTLTCTSKVKYFFRFLMIMTRNGSLIPNVFFGSAGQVMYVVLQKEEIPINTPLVLSSVVCTAATHGPTG